LDRCAVTHKRALKNLFIKSSISHMTILEEAAIRSAAGKYCMPSEAQICSWSERRFHPDDLQACSLVGLTVHFSFLTDTGQPRLKPLVEMLDGNRKNADGIQVWLSAATRLAKVHKVGKCRVEAATKSPSDHLLAMSCETKALLGLRVHQLGAVFDTRRNDFVGRVVDGKRRPTGWTQSQ
jgi:hypothetical protein